MDTALVIMLLCDGDKHAYRDFVKENCSGDGYYYTIEDMIRLYEETGWKAENERQ